MAVYTPEQYAKKIERMKQGLDRVARQSPNVASRFMVARAKQYAPRATGDTVQGIRRRRSGKHKWIVISRVPGIFKQNLFANRTRPYDIISYGKESEQPYYAVPQDVTYGKPALSASGEAIKWTAQRTPFWDMAILDVRKRFLKEARKGIRTVIK